MPAVAGVFKSRSDADTAIASLQAAGIDKSQISILTPELAEQELSTVVPATQGEQPGMVKAMGAVAGGAVGLGLGEAIAALLVPGVGPVLAVGIAAGTVLGAITGGAAGKALESSVFPGIPEEELFVYEDALRHGRTLVVTTAHDENAAKTARAVMERAGAESIDRAREIWWLGLRDVEKESYEATGDSFETHEDHYRRGFEAGVRAGNGQRSSASSNSDTAYAVSGGATANANTQQQKAFQRGYERGCAYRERVKAETRKT